MARYATWPQPVVRTMTGRLALRTATEMRVLGLTLGCVLCIAACGSDQAPAEMASSHAPQRSVAASTYRFERPPTVVFVSGGSTSPGDFWVFARMNRPVPRNAHGIRATFALDGGTRPFGTPTTNSRRPPCYSVEISAGDNPKAPPNIVNPQDGALVTVTLHFPGRDAASVTVAARAVDRHVVGSDKANAKYLRTLGCRGRAATRQQA